MNPVLQSIEPIIQNLKHVKINTGAVLGYAESVQVDTHEKIGFGPFDISSFSKKDQLHILLVLNATNFCYWGEPKWSLQMDGKDLGGQWGNVFCILRALKQGVPMTSAEYLSNMTLEQCEHFYAANVSIPLLRERWKILQEIGRGLQTCDGDFENFVRNNSKDAWSFLDELVRLFPSFDDSYVLEGKRIIFQKRAQLFLALLESFSLISMKVKNDDLTAFADYKQPISLERLKLISVDPKLREKIMNHEVIAEGSREEIELRAVQVWICELLRAKLVLKNPDVTAPLVSTHFWLLAKEKHAGDMPHHRTFTTRY